MSDSLWKKEISFRRKPKEEAPAAVPELEPVVAIEPEPAPVPEPAEDAAVPAELPAPKGDYGWLTTSFDPNDLPDEMPAIAAPPVSGPPPVRVPLAETASSSPVDLEPVAAPAAPESAAAEPDAKPTPFWKKELSLGSGSKEPKAPKQPKAAKKPRRAKEPKGTWDPAEQTLPFWKRELKFERKPKEAKLPKGEQQPKGAKAPKQPREKKAKVSKSGIVG
ncbi:MAG TPA: hypothetical protein VIL92_04810, partial [Gaiellaceae bacterium]